jgi:FG-GAP repeat
MSAALFDAAYYSAVNPDLAAAGLKTETQLSAHFENFGLNEGRAFSPLVNLKYYRDNNPDLTAAGLTTFRQLYEHLQTFGIAEGRRFSPWVDLNFYLAANPDVNQAYKGDRQQAFNHLQQFGLTEGRQFSPWVDLGFYLAANPDVSQVFRGDRKQALTHLQNFGLTEGRRFSPVVNLDFYLGDNPDLLRVFGRDRQRTFEHLQTYGIDEGRRFSLTFEPTYYSQVNPDFAAAKLNYRQLLQHFQIYGVNEGRSASEFFDLPFYRKINPDLGAAGLTNRQALQHFLLWGQAEHRWPFDLFSNVAYLDANPDVKQAVEQGRLSSGFEHYFNFGASEGRAIRTIPNPKPERIPCSYLCGLGYDLFGSSVAAFGNNLLVGVPGENVGDRFGAVYLFNGLTGTILQTFQNPGQGLYFADSVAAVGNNVLIGESDLYINNFPAAGAAYLFDGSTGALLRTFQNPDPQFIDYFGRVVAAAGNNALIAAPNDDTGATDTGSVYLFDSVTGNLLQTFHNPNPRQDDHFGRSMAAVGNNILIGSPNDNSGTSKPGAAYLFDSVTGDLLQTFRNPNPGQDDDFGASVALAGNNVLIGAPGDNSTNPQAGNSKAGAAYLFDSVTGNLLQTFHNPNPAVALFNRSEDFGAQVAAIGNKVLIAEPNKDIGDTSSVGVAYLFDATTGVLLQTLQNPTPATWEGFGASVAAAGNHFLIGVPGDTVGSFPVTGAVYLF